jgi:hypothetical protein
MDWIAAANHPGSPDMITAKSMADRTQNLAEWTRNLTKEAETPLWPLEKRSYLLAIQQMVAGLVEAREVLAKALPRVERAEAHLRQ